MTFKFKLRLYLAILVSATLLISIFIFNLSLFFLNQRSLNNSLLAEGNELIRTHLVVTDGQIFFRRDDQGNSLAAYLVDEDISALIADRNQNIIAKYGIYHDLKIPDSAESNSPIFKSIIIDQNYYLTAILPINGNSARFGTLYLAKTDYFRQTLLPISIMVGLATIVFSLIIVWLVGDRLLKQLISPLDEFILAMRRNSLDDLRQIDIAKNSPPEIGAVVNNYNLMVTKLKDDLHLQEQFISSASHEIKTPISSAISSLDLAVMDLSDKNYGKIANRLNTVKDQLKSLSSLVNQLLTISSLKLKSLPLEHIDLITFFDELLRSHSSEIATKKIKIDMRLDPKLSVAFPRTHLYLIFDNLLSNAIKYNPISGKIIITAKSTANRISINLADTGPGISPEESDLIFARFYRSNSTRHQHTGDGLGLSIVKDLCRLHSLSLKLESRLGVGSTFTVGGFSSS